MASPLGCEAIESIWGGPGSIEELERIVGQIRRHWPRARIYIRGDSGFCRDSIIKWCEDHGVGFVLGLARIQRLVRALGAAMHEAHSVHRRTSAHTMRANQLRLYFSSFAYVLMHALRRLGTEDTQLGRAQCSTLRLKLLKIGARVKITAPRGWLSFSQAYPYAKIFTQVLKSLHDKPLGNPSG